MKKKRSRRKKPFSLFVKFIVFIATALSCSAIMLGAFALQEKHQQRVLITQKKPVAKPIKPKTVAKKRSAAPSIDTHDILHAHEEVPYTTNKKVAIIIDDIGYTLAQGRRALSLPGAITIAILPFTPHAHTLAQDASQAGKEVMLHAPMEPERDIYWGEGLRKNMPEQEIRHTLNAMLDDIPQARGVNNHMGSGLTQERNAMHWIMSELFARGLYFIDSRTSAKSEAWDMALILGIPSYKRDIFLDNTRDITAIEKQFNKMIAMAKLSGSALAIGHPYPETLQVLEANLPILEEHGIDLVPVSALLEHKNLLQAFAP